MAEVVKVVKPWCESAGSWFNSSRVVLSFQLSGWTLASSSRRLAFEFRQKCILNEYQQLYGATFEQTWVIGNWWYIQGRKRHPTTFFASSPILALTFEWKCFASHSYKWCGRNFSLTPMSWLGIELKLAQLHVLEGPSFRTLYWLSYRGYGNTQPHKNM